MERIPCYIVNLEKRKDRRDFIIDQFSSREEFDVNIVTAIEDPDPTVSLYYTLLSIIRKAKYNKNRFVLFCEDDHAFTSEYDVNNFSQIINELQKKHAHILLGGASWFSRGIPVSSNLFWINGFTGAQFMIIYSEFFDTILEAEFTIGDTIDHWISKLTDKIFVRVPMISIQCEFGYSDVTTKNSEIGRVDSLFHNTGRRFHTLRQISKHIKKISDVLVLNPIQVDHDISIHTYIFNADRCSKHTKLLCHDEFDIHMLQSDSAREDQISTWNAIRNSVKCAVETDADVIIVSEAEVILLEKKYCKNDFFSGIFKGAYLGADLIIGNLSEFDQAIIVDESLCWIDSFKVGAHFFILYRSFFDSILDAEFTESDRVDVKLSLMTANKYVMHPFIVKAKKSTFFNEKDKFLQSVAKTNSAEQALNQERKNQENMLKMFSI